MLIFTNEKDHFALVTVRTVSETIIISFSYSSHAIVVVQGREEQAEPDDMKFVAKAANLLGIDPDVFVDTFMKPKLKVRINSHFKSACMLA